MGQTIDTLEAATRCQREAIVTAVNNGRGSEELAKLVNDLAAAEGARAARWRVEAAFNRGGEEAAMREKIDLLSAYPNDTWSGRANDVRRAFNDGQRDAIRDLRWT